MKIDISTWENDKSCSTFNRKLYYDINQKTFFLEICSNDWEVFKYFKSNDMGEELEYLGYTDYQNSVFRYNLGLNKNIIIDLNKDFSNE